MPPDSPIKIASLHFGDGEFVVLKSGTHVRCAVTGEAIPLMSLRYWSAVRQEAYRSPVEYLSAHKTASNADA